MVSGELGPYFPAGWRGSFVRDGNAGCGMESLDAGCSRSRAEAATHDRSSLLAMEDQEKQRIFFYAVLSNQLDI